MKRFVLASFVTVLSSVTATASAQVWLKDRANTSGPGIRGGDLEYHPGIAAEVGYDSNYFQRPNTTQFPNVDTVKLRITPSFSVSTLTSARKDGAPAPPPKVSFSAGAALVYSEFLTNTDKLGTAANPRNREFGVLADLALLIAPGRPIGFNIYDNFSRTVQPSLDADPTVGLDRDENRAAGELVWTKTGGLLDWRLGYANSITYFERSPANDLNNVRHEIYTRGRWRFLPRTALIYDGNLSFIRYGKNTPGTSDSTPLRTRIGVSGLITDRTALTLMAGWGASFYAKPGVGQQDFDSVIGQAEIRYFLTGAAPEAGTQAPAMSSFAIGFTRDFYNSYLGNWYERDRGYLSVNALIAQSFFLSIDTGAAYIKYSDARDRNTGAPLVNGSPNVVRIDASLFAEYRIKDWLGINATFQYLGDLTDTNLRYPVVGLVPLKFNRFQALGGIRAMF